MPNNYPTAAGRSKQAQSEEKKLAMVDAINQVFTLFRLNYHNQYLKAFGNTGELSEVKRLWLEMLSRFDSPTILRAAKHIIENSEFLPTLHTMIHACEKTSSQHFLPDAHSAYIEACRAPSPKAAHQWSHPAVYHAGKNSDWYFLQSSSESVAYPVFKEKYEQLCEEVRNGVELNAPSAPALEEQKAQPLDKQSNQKKLKAFRESLNL